MKHCGDCDDAVFDHRCQWWKCRKLGVVLCRSAKWPNRIEAKDNLDELECYLEYEAEE